MAAIAWWRGRPAAPTYGPLLPKLRQPSHANLTSVNERLVSPAGYYSPWF